MAEQIIDLPAPAVIVEQIRKLKDYRCRTCQKLLFRGRITGTSEIEIRCPRCSRILIVTAEQ